MRMNKTKAILALLVTSILCASFFAPATAPVIAQNVTPELRYEMPVLSWDDISVDTGAGIEMQLRKIGIKIDVAVTDDAVMYPQLYEIREGKREYQLYCMSHGYSSIPDHVWWAMHSENDVEWGENPYRLHNDTMDAALDAYMGATPAEVKAASKTVQIYAKQNMPYIPLFLSDDTHAIRKEWTNYAQIPGGLFTDFNLKTMINMYSTEGKTTFVNAYPSDIGEMNPLFARSARTTWFNMLVYDQLVAFDEELNPIPWLAESFELTPDGKQVTFTIRSGIKWHDGEDLTPEDVKFTFEYWKATPEEAGAEEWSFLQHIVNVKVEGQNVILTLDQPMAFAIEIYGDMYPILPKHIREGIPQDDARWDDGSDASIAAGNHIGSGPFKVVKRVPDEFVELTRFDDWWGPKPHIQTVRIDVVRGQDPRILAMIAGDVDTERYELFGPYVKQVQLEPDLDVVLGLPSQWDYRLGFNLETPGLDDVRVRRAIAHAIDREGLVKIGRLGHGTITNSVIPKSFFPAYYDPAGDFWEFDLDIANQILDDAGYLDVDNDHIREFPGASPIGPTTVTKTVVPELIGIIRIGWLLLATVTVALIFVKKRRSIV